MKRAFIFFLLLILWPGFSCLVAQDIWQWRGMNRTGQYPSEDLLSEWPKEGPRLLMLRENLPASYSSVVMKDDVIYTTGVRDGEEIMTALYPDGSTKWESTYGNAWDQSFPNARSTPTIDGERAYVISGRGDLACLDIYSGRLIWTLEGHKKFKGRWGKWGTAESPLIIDNKMIYTPGGMETTMVALDKKSGELIWKSKSIQDKAAYTSPALAIRDSLKMIITVTANYVVSVNADKGEILWKFRYTDVESPESGGGINPVTPIVVGNEVFVTSGYNHAGIMLSMAEDYRSVSLKWKTKDLDVHHGGVVHYDGYLYGANFTSVIDGNWLCLDWESGKLQYTQNWKGKGSIVTSGGYLFCYEERRGNIALVKANPESFEIVSEFRIPFGRGPHWSHPSIYDDKLYIRHGKALCVYRIGK